MKSTLISASVAAMILAFSPVQATHSATRVQESEAEATAHLNHQSFQAAQTGRAAEAAQPKPAKAAESDAAKVRAKALRRAYAVRARIAKQKKQLAKPKRPSLKSKKKMVTA